MLPPLLGKGFFVKRKLPVAVDLTKKDLRGELEKGVCSALYRHGAGTSNSMQVGTCVQTPAQLVENVVAAVEQAVRLIPGKWSNVQSLSLRTTNSVALPFYNSMPHE
jgi:ribosome biogenesis protein UTP30